MRARLSLLALLPLLCIPAAAQNDAGAALSGPGPWMVRAWFGTDEAIREVASWGDHYSRDRKLGFLRLLADPERLEQLRALGFYVENETETTALIRHAEEAGRRAEEMRARGETPEAGIPGFPCYRTVEETFASAEALVGAHPELATWIDIGDSWDKITAGGPEGYDLKVLKLTNAAIPGPKPVLFANSAIHAREYTTAELMTRFAEQLVNGYGSDPDATWVLDRHEIHLLLHTNPDGRKKAETGLSWRKNTNQSYCGAASNSRGADLNRNFSFQWNCCGGSDSNPCGETFHGASSASEPEVQAIQNYIQSIFPDQRGPTFPGGGAPADATGIYLDVHSFSQLVLWPWGGTDTPTDNATAFQTLGRRFAWFTGYLPEQAIDLYPTDGTTIDFAYGDLGVAAFTFELGNAFFESCSSFESAVLPANLQALRYAMKVVHAPYLTPKGPDALAVAVVPNVIAPGDAVEVTATLDDTRFSNANGTEPTFAIAAAEIRIELPGGDPIFADGFESGDTSLWTASAAWPVAMTADDGVFDESVEPAAAEIETSNLPDGRHLLYVRGRDAAGNWGPVTAAFLTVIDPATAPTLHGTVLEEGTGTPLAANVAVGPYTTTTDGAGDYSIQVPPGTYDVTVTAADHAPQTVAGVSLAPLQSLDQDFSLAPFASVYDDDVEAGVAGWTAQSPWAIGTAQAHSPTHSWTDSPAGNYSNNMNTAVTSPAIDLSAATGVELSFWERHATEAGWDYCRVEVSANNGSTWTEVAAYDGTQTTWTRRVFVLPQLVGAAQARVRFRLTSDVAQVADGCYVDDVVVRAAI
jgi:carboxypeptidase T